MEHNLTILTLSADFEKSGLPVEIIIRTVDRKGAEALENVLGEKSILRHNIASVQSSVKLVEEN